MSAGARRWGALAALLLLLLVAAAPSLLLGGGMARGWWEELAARSLGRELRVETLRWSWLPPRLILTGPRLAGHAPDAAPLLEASRLVLRPALPPLGGGALRFRWARIEGARVTLVRRAAGLGAAPAQAAPGMAAAGGAWPGPRAPLVFGAVELRDGELVFEDPLVSPPLRWQLRWVRGSLEAGQPGQPLRFAAELVFDDGGRLELTGSRVAQLAELQVRLGGLDLVRLQPYVDEAAQLSGRADGWLRLTWVGPRLAALSLEVEAAQAGLKLDRARVEGPVSLQAQLAAGSDGLAGSFGVDAARARLDVGGAYQKPPGEPARLEGRIAVRSDGRLTLDDLDLRIGGPAPSAPGDGPSDAS